jgi:hypothetical protein
MIARGASLVLLLAVWTSLVPVASAQSPVDPQSLVGDWQGTWKPQASTKRNRTGSYHLSVERVEGARVSGKVLKVDDKLTEEKTFTGRLNGNVLTYGTVELTVDGARMSGKSGAGRGGFDIELQKSN